jgi:CheY-like chemotaxis protein
MTSLDPLPALKRPCLLLVEDDDGVRRSLQLLLQGQGYDVRSFASARPALADFASMEAGYLVIDYMLADSDGIAFLRHLRERGWRGVPILITAFASPAVRGSARDAGFVRVLDKPFRDDALISALAGAADSGPEPRHSR